MLPIPFLNYIPKLFKKSQGAITLANKVDQILNSIKSDVLGMKRSIRPDEARLDIVKELGTLLRAGIQSKDSESVIRSKVANAISLHKKRGQFVSDIKPIIDAITGYSCAIYVPSTSAERVFVGDTPQEVSYWASMGANNLDTNLGQDILSSGDSEYDKGNFYINLHPGTTTPVLSLTVLLDIIDTLTSYIKLAYVRLFLGYVDSSGNFVHYKMPQMPEVALTSTTTLHLSWVIVDGVLWLKRYHGGDTYSSDTIVAVDTFTGATIFTQTVPTWCERHINLFSAYSANNCWMNGKYVLTGDVICWASPMRLHTINTKTRVYKNMTVESNFELSMPIFGFCYLNGCYYIARGAEDSTLGVYGCSIVKVDATTLAVLQRKTLHFAYSPSTGRYIPVDIVSDGTYVYMYTQEVSNGRVSIRKFSQDLQQIFVDNIKLTQAVTTYVSVRGLYRNGYIYMGSTGNSNVSRYEIATGKEKIFTVFNMPNSGYIDFDPYGNLYCIGSTRSYQLGSYFVVFAILQKTDRKLVFPITVHGEGGTTSLEQFCFFDSKYIYVVDDDLSFSGPTLIIGPNKKLRRYVLKNNIIGDSP